MLVLSTAGLNFIFQKVEEKDENRSAIQSLPGGSFCSSVYWAEDLQRNKLL